ncbi:hypothetical protein B484DRAFT_437021, partial [Ochromonadaceae sp. CCMP2298]
VKTHIQDLVSKSLFLMQDLLREREAAAERERERLELQKKIDLGEGGGGEEGAALAAEAALALLPPLKITQLRKDAQGNADFSALLAAKGPVSIKPVGLDKLQALLAIPRTTEEGTHSLIMHQILTLSHLLNNTHCLQNAAIFILTSVWDPADPFVRKLLDNQIECLYLVADSLPQRIRDTPKSQDKSQKGKSQKYKSQEGGGGGQGSQEGKSQEGSESKSQDMKSQEPDPRSLGLTSPLSDEITHMKRMVIHFLQKGISLSVVLMDPYALQNGVIYFWNLHVHLFRQGLYLRAMEEVQAFV